MSLNVVVLTFGILSFSYATAEINNYKSSLTFVIDDTGSMGNDIEEVISGANAIFDTVLNSNASQIENFILITFNDFDGIIYKPEPEKQKPGVKERAITKSRDVFKKALNNIEVDGGGDCPEYSMAGIKAALEKSLPLSYLYVFTDASAKDYGQFEEVKSIALKKQCQIVFVLTGDCDGPTESPDNKVYYDLASATFGEVFNIEKQEVGMILAYVRNKIKSRDTLIGRGTFPPGKNSLNVTTDSKMNDFTLSVTSKDRVKPLVDIAAPDGSKPNKTVLVQTDKNVIYTVNISTPGNHKIEVDSPSATTVVMTAKSDIDFRHGFSAYMPSTLKETTTKPLPGEKSYLAIKLVKGDIELKSAKILDLSGNTIRELPLEIVNNKTKFYATEAFEPPSRMFKLSVIGYDPETRSNITRMAPTSIEVNKPIPGKVITPQSPMVFIEGDTNIHAKFNEKLQLTCLVYGYPKPNIVWKDIEKGTIIPGTVYVKELPYDFINVLIIEKVTGNATYECSASNPFGSNSTTVTVETEDDRHFTVLKTPRSIKIEYGKEGKIQCLVDVYPPAQISWFKNGKALVPNDHIEISSNESTVTIKNTDLSDKGNYMCEAKNENNRTLLFKSVTVTGAEHPLIDKKTTNMFVRRDFNVDLDCNLLKGKPKPSIRWYYSGMASESVLYLPQYDDKESISIPLAAKTDSGQYKCKAENEIGMDFHSVNLVVEFPPQIKTDVDFIRAALGSEISIHCDAVGGPSPYVTWHKNGVKVMNNSKIHTSGNNKVTLRLSVDDLSDGGNYSCIATNRFGTATRTVHVNVNVPVTITPPIISNVDVPVGKKITLPCEAHGLPKPNIRWVYNSLNAGSTNMREMEYKGKGPLDLERLQINDEGYYTCIASNTEGSMNITYRLHVTAAPIIENTYKDKHFVAVEGDRALRISCKASGNPKPEITWTKDGLDIALGETYSVEESTLIIKDVPQYASGFYTCRADNNIGTAQELYEVSVEKYPAPGRPMSSIWVEQGKRNEIKCDLPHSRINQLRWYKDRVLIRTGELTLNNPLPEDAGVYTCRVGDLFKSVSKDVQINVGHKPKLNWPEEENIELLEGPLTLACDASGLPAPIVSWYKDGLKVNITETSWDFPNAINSPGQYRCELSNTFGTISKTFNVFPRDCYINTDKLTILQPLLLSSNVSWPIFTKNNEFINLLQGEQFLLFCPKGFKHFRTKYITGFCDGGMTVMINGVKYDYANIECTEEIKHEIQYTGESCMAGETEKVIIGYKILKEKITPVYEICMDTLTNLPLYVKHSMQSSLADNDIKTFWSDGDRFPIDFEDAYDCESQTRTISARLGKSFHTDDGCCFSKRQLVNPKDVFSGVAQKATYSYLNVVPHWGTCNSDNWDDIEERVRKFAKDSYGELIVWTGVADKLALPSYASNTTTFVTDSSGNRQTVPLYLWKVVQDPATNSSLAIIQINVPDLNPSEVSKYIKCSDLCNRTIWMKSPNWHDASRGYTYCCSLPEFERAFSLRGVFNRGMTNILSYEASYLPEVFYNLLA